MFVYRIYYTLPYRWAFLFWSKGTTTQKGLPVIVVNRVSNVSLVCSHSCLYYIYQRKNFRRERTHTQRYTHAVFFIILSFCFNFLSLSCLFSSRFQPKLPFLVFWIPFARKPLHFFSFTFLNTFHVCVWMCVWLFTTWEGGKRESFILPRSLRWPYI